MQFRAKAGQDLIANPTGIDSKLAQLLGLRVDGRRSAHRRRQGPAAAADRRHPERKTALQGVEQKELAALTKLANTMLR